MRVYITGIAGMLGYYLGNKLSSNHDVYGCDIVELSNKTDFAKVSMLDLSDFDKAEKELISLCPDIIIHTAACINVDYCENEKDKAFLLNADVTGNLTKVAEKIGARVIYISTDAVFDGKLDKAYAEDDIVNTINIYGASKLKGEEFVLKNNGLNTVLRTNIYGWNIQNKVSFAEWIYNSLREKKSITMYDDLYYTPIYVGSLYNIIKQIIELNISGLFHAAGGEACSKYEFAIALANEFNLSKKLILKGSCKNLDFIAKRSCNMKLDSSKIQKKLAYRIPGIKEGLMQFKKDMIDYGKN